jgi:hypothetical protein
MEGGVMAVSRQKAVKVAKGKEAKYSASIGYVDNGYISVQGNSFIVGHKASNGQKHFMTVDLEAVKEMVNQ